MGAIIRSDTTELDILASTQQHQHQFRVVKVSSAVNPVDIHNETCTGSYLPNITSNIHLLSSNLSSSLSSINPLLNSSVKPLRKSHSIDVGVASLLSSRAAISPHMLPTPSENAVYRELKPKGGRNQWRPSTDSELVTPGVRMATTRAY
ncbi:unnamed protein product, partial [Protopolystoma xenopodis]